MRSLALISFLVLGASVGRAEYRDVRNIVAGKVIANITSGYADQPMVLQRDDGAWVVSLTHNPSHEGGDGEAVYTAISNDFGNSWTEAMPVCLTCGDEQYAYSTLMRSNAVKGRLYVIYVFNYQNITAMPDGTKLPREDMMGGFFLRYSDNGGKTWSKNATQIPIRRTKIDAMNQWNGTVQLMWMVDKGFQLGEAAYVMFTKIGHYAVDPPTSGWLLYSPNLGSAKTPEDIQWRVLPEGDNGIRSYHDLDVEHGCGLDGVGNGACITSESHVVPLDDEAENLFVVFRTDAGYLGAARSSDSGSSFDVPYVTSNYSWAVHYAEPGSPGEQLVRPLKQPRGPMTPLRVPKAASSQNNTDRADLLLLYYNNGHVAPAPPSIGVWTNRNPYWLVPGYIVESDDSYTVEFGEPEIGLYNPDPSGRGCGYPDFIIRTNTSAKSGFDVWITETEKVSARLHKVDELLLQGLLDQKVLNDPLSGESFAFDNRSSPPGTVLESLPMWPSLSLPSPYAVMSSKQQGLAATLWFDGITQSGKNQTIFDSTRYSDDGSGLTIQIGPDSLGNDALQIVLVDNLHNASLTFGTDASCSDWLQADGNVHFAAFSVDAGSRVVTAVVDGVLCDGGPQSWTIHPQTKADIAAFQGWATLPPALTNLNSANATSVRAIVSPEYDGFVHSASFFPRYLRTAEMLSAWRHGR